jgi:hypothetical protein
MLAKNGLLRAVGRLRDGGWSSWIAEISPRVAFQAFREVEMSALSAFRQ